MSRALHVLHVMYEPLLIMARTLLSLRSVVHSSKLPVTPLGEDEEVVEVRAMPIAPSCAIADDDGVTARLVCLRKTHPKALAVQLADRPQTRLEVLWGKGMQKQPIGLLLETKNLSLIER